MNKLKLVFLATALAALALSGRSLSAHGLHYPKRLALRLAGSELQVAIDCDVEPGPAALATRDRFDGNADGRLDAQEQRALLDFLAARALRTLAIRYGGQLLVLRETGRHGYGDDESTRSSALIGVHLELRATLAPSRKDSALVIADSIPDSGHEVAANFTVAAPWKVVSLEAGQLSAASNAGETVIKSIYLDAGKPARFVLAPPRG